MSSKVRQRWLDSLRARGTKIQYDWALSKFLDMFKVTEEETLEWDIKEVKRKLQDFKTGLMKTELSGSSVRVAFTAVKQWFHFNDIEVNVICKNVSTTKQTFDYIPSKEDVQRLLDAAKLHHKVAIGLIAFAGLRPSDVATLQYKHIRKSYEAGDEVLTIIKQQQKSNEWYPSFLGYQGTRYIRSFLEHRREKGEKITNKSHVVVWDKGPMDARSITLAIRRVIDRTTGKYPTGEPFRRFRTYSLRKYFRRTAGKLGEDIAELLMGHKKGIENLSATYSGLRDMDPQAIEHLKKRYIEILPELETEVTEPGLRFEIEELKKERDEKEERIRSFEKTAADLRQQQEKLFEFQKRLEKMMREKED